MAKKAQEFDLSNVFERREDGRLYCVTCDFDTAQESNARFHAEVVHQVALRPTQVVVKARGEQREEIVEIITVEKPPEGA